MKTLLPTFGHAIGKTIDRVEEHEWNAQMCLHFTDGTALVIEASSLWDEQTLQAKTVFAATARHDAVQLGVMTQTEANQLDAEDKKRYEERKHNEDVQEYLRLKKKLDVQYVVINGRVNETIKNQGD